MAIKLKQSIGKAASILSRNLYIQVSALALLTVLAVVLMLLADRSLGGSLTSNLPAEALGVAVSALVTVVIVERALAMSEKRQWAAALRSTLRRMMGDCDYCVSYLALKARRPGDTLPEGNANIAAWLSRAVQTPDSFSHLDRDGHGLLLEDLRRRHGFLQDSAVRVQVVLARKPVLFHHLQELDRAMLYWLGVHAAYDLTDNRAKRCELVETEAGAVRDVARKLLGLRGEIQGAIGDGEDE